MIDVWERSVRATHDFLDRADIDFYKSIVSQIDFGAFQSYCILDDRVRCGIRVHGDGTYVPLDRPTDRSHRIL